MKVLPPEQYSIDLSALKSVEVNHLFAKAVLLHHVAGKVYTDDINLPQAFYIVHPYGMSLLFGKVSDEFLNNDLKHYCLGTCGTREQTEWLQVFPAELQRRVEECFDNKLSELDANDLPLDAHAKVVKHVRVNFAFDRDKYQQYRSEIQLDDFNCVAVDKVAFGRIQGSVIPARFWNDADEFFTRSIGFSLKVDDVNVATSFAAFLMDGKLELGMETDSQHRNRGFGSIITARLIEHAFENQLEPIWSCRKGNKGSFNLAQKLGFEPTLELPFYELRLV